MADTNSYYTAEAATLQSPLTFAATAASMVTAQAHVQSVINLIATEGRSESEFRLFLDEMRPAARLSMVAILTALKASLT